MIDPAQRLPILEHSRTMIVPTVLLWTEVETSFTRRCLASAPMACSSAWSAVPRSRALALALFPRPAFRSHGLEPRRGGSTRACSFSLATYFGVDSSVRRWSAAAHDAPSEHFSGASAAWRRSVLVRGSRPTDPAAHRPAPRVARARARPRLSTGRADRHAALLGLGPARGRWLPSASPPVPAAGPVGGVSRAIAAVAWGPLVPAWAAERRPTRRVLDLVAHRCSGSAAPSMPIADFADDALKERLVAELHHQVDRCYDDAVAGLYK